MKLSTLFAFVMAAIVALTISATASARSSASCKVMNMGMQAKPDGGMLEVHVHSYKSLGVKGSGADEIIKRKVSAARLEALNKPKYAHLGVHFYREDAPGEFVADVSQRPIVSVDGHNQRLILMRARNASAKCGLHYGTNVLLPPEEHHMIIVKFNGQEYSFMYMAGAGHDMHKTHMSGMEDMPGMD